MNHENEEKRVQAFIFSLVDRGACHVHYRNMLEKMREKDKSVQIGVREVLRGKPCLHHPMVRMSRGPEAESWQSWLGFTSPLWSSL